jgi:hypothetical protein
MSSRPIAKSPSAPADASTSESPGSGHDRERALMAAPSRVRQVHRTRRCDRAGVHGAHSGELTYGERASARAGHVMSRGSRRGPGCQAAPRGVRGVYRQARDGAYVGFAGRTRGLFTGELEGTAPPRSICCRVRRPAEHSRSACKDHRVGAKGRVGRRRLPRRLSCDPGRRGDVRACGATRADLTAELPSLHLIGRKRRGANRAGRMSSVS